MESHPISSFVGHTVVQLAHVLAQRMAEQLAPFELTPTSFSALFHLVRTDEQMSAAELARRVLVTPQSVGPLLDDLERAGLVARVRPSRRGQRVTTTVTDAGRQRLRDATAAVVDLDRSVMGVLTPTAQPVVAAALAQMLEAASALPKGRST